MNETQTDVATWIEEPGGMKLEPTLGPYTVHLALGCDTREQAEAIKEKIEQVMARQ